MRTNELLTIGSTVSQIIERYNKNNKSRQFSIDEQGMNFSDLLDLYDHCNDLFSFAPATQFSKTLHQLLKSAILLMPVYSTDITSEEDKGKSREPWEGPVRVQLYVSSVSELFYELEYLIEFLANMHSLSEIIDGRNMQNKIESLEKQIKETA